MLQLLRSALDMKIILKKLKMKNLLKSLDFATSSKQPSTGMNLPEENLPEILTLLNVATEVTDDEENEPETNTDSESDVLLTMTRHCIKKTLIPEQILWKKLETK